MHFPWFRFLRGERYFNEFNFTFFIFFIQCHCKIPISSDAQLPGLEALVSSLSEKLLDRIRLYLSIVRSMKYELTEEIQKVSYVMRITTKISRTTTSKGLALITWKCFASLFYSIIHPKNRLFPWSHNWPIEVASELHIYFIKGIQSTLVIEYIDILKSF